MIYPPINVKTDYSLLNSLIKIDDLIVIAKNNNLKTLFIADDNLYGAYEFYKKCVSNDIKPIIGLCKKINDVELILYAKNNQGYKNLIKIDAYEEYEKYTDNIVCIFKKGYDEKIAKLFEKCYKSDELPLEEVRCLDESNLSLLKVLAAIKDSKVIDEVSLDENLAHFQTNNSKNINELINLCNISFEKEINPIPKVSNNSYELLKQKCIDGMKKRFGDKVSVSYKERLKKELDIIKSMGYEDYFIIVSDYVSYAKSQDILVGPGRGSAAASLVSYVLFITDVDPLKYDLLFERFLNPSRKNLPDIDIDFEFNRRQEVINYCVSKYGKEKVGGIITFSKMSAKQVLRDVSKAYSINNKTTDYLVGLVDSKLSLKENLNNNIKLKDYLKKDKELLDVYKTSLMLEGLKKHKSTHAAGIIISQKNLDEIVPIDVHDDINIAGYTMDYLEDLGLLKMDFLGLKNLTLVKDIINDIEDNVEFSKINLEDAQTYELFKNVKTAGIFQFETDGMQEFLFKLKPSSFSDLCAAIALYRPGPMKNIDKYIKRKQGLEKIHYFHDDLKDILEETYGIIIYQEQIIKIANILAGYDYGRADVLRRAMAKKDMKLLESSKEDFIQRAVKQGYDNNLAVKVYDHILMFADYGFNKAHSVSYALISYKMAYLKANYPKHFFKNILNHTSFTDVKMKEFFYEAKNLDIDILKPCINKSTKQFEIDGYSLRCPISMIRGMSPNFIEKIINNKPYGNLFELFIKCELTKKDLDNISKLCKGGALESLGYNKKTIMSNIDNIFNYVEIYEEGITNEPELTTYEEYSSDELLSMELEIYGFYISDHPALKHKTKYDIDLSNVNKYFDKHVSAVVLVERLKTITTKSGKEMAFATCSDESSSIELVLFPEVYSENQVNKNDIIKVKAHVEKRYDKYQLIVNEINKF